MRFMVSNQSMEVCALSGSRRVKKSQTPAGTVLAAPGQGQGRALESCSPGAGVAYDGLSGGGQTGGFDLEIGSD
jgi:hypothetical protein